MSKQIKPLIKQTITEEHLDKSPKRIDARTFVKPADEPGKGKWYAADYGGSKANPPYILYKRKVTVLVANPKLEAHQQKMVMDHFSKVAVTAEHVEDSDNENARPKSPQGAYARSLLGYPPKQGAPNRNNRNNDELANMFKGMKMGGKRTRKGKRSTRKNKSRKH